MKPTFWENLWEINDIKFHKIDTHPLLIQFADQLPRIKTIVPLSGKSLDMLWLRNEGHKVVGFELSEIACEAFFSENHIQFTKSKQGHLTIYRGDRISIWCGDIFDVPDSAWTGMTGIYDRAALVALPSPMRKKYTVLLTDQIKKNKATFKTLLLICVEFEGIKNDAPPFSITKKEVLKLFGKSLQCESLTTRMDPSLSGRAPRFQGMNVQETIYRMKPK